MILKSSWIVIGSLEIRIDAAFLKLDTGRMAQRFASSNR
jgi:hypothetical protein